jgi:TatD DNase family protein
MFEFIDIGANLTHDSFESDRSEVIRRAIDAGVKQLIVTGTTLADSRHGLELALAHPQTLFATAGVHPHHAAEVDAETIEGLRQLAAHESIVAIGECGLDFFRNYSPRDVQLDGFEKQLRLATESGKPVFLHQRDAHDAMTGLLPDYLPHIVGGVAHCFTGSARELKDYLDMGLYVGITGWICDERRGESLRQAVRQLPLDRLLLETDAPYLLPRDLDSPPRGRRNEPKFLPHIAARLAALLEVPVADVAAAATANAERLFVLTGPDAGA